MPLHVIQEKLLKITGRINLKKMSLREIGSLVDETHPQKIRHHLNQLEKKGFIAINRKTGEIKLANPDLKKPSGDIAVVPVYGNADCGEACAFADDKILEYIRVSKSLIGRVKNIFAVRAKGPSMNRAKVNGRYNIEEGDYVLVDPDNKNPRSGDYILSVIDECANIKKFFYDKKNGQIILASESTENIPKIYIHENDKYMINGLVKNVLKNTFARGWEDMQDSAGEDALNSLGPIRESEVRYYRKLKS